MSHILLGAIIAVTLFVAAIYFLITGVIKKRKRSIYISIVFLLLTLGAGIWTGVLFASKAYNKVKDVKLTNPFKARTGLEIYTALFGAPKQNCVEVINKTDQLVPRLDCCIWLEFTTCPAELQRVIALAPYKASTYIAGDISGYSPRPKWFNPGILGDSVIMLRNYDPADPNHDQLLFISRDSTHAFYCDMAD